MSKDRILVALGRWGVLHPTYELVETNGVKGIKCLCCELISYNQGDVEQLYCGHCHKFHLRGEGDGGR